MRPSSAAPSALRPRQDTASAEPPVPSAVLLYAQRYTGQEGSARPSSATPSVLRGGWGQREGGGTGGGGSGRAWGEQGGGLGGRAVTDGLLQQQQQAVGAGSGTSGGERQQRQWCGGGDGEDLGGCALAVDPDLYLEGSEDEEEVSASLGSPVSD